MPVNGGMAWECGARESSPVFRQGVNTTTQIGTLELAGRAICTPTVWQDGKSSGGQLVAQVFADGDRDLPECAEFLGKTPLLPEDVTAERYAALLAAAPDLLNALEIALATIERLRPSSTGFDSTRGTKDVICAAITKATR